MDTKPFRLLWAIATALVVTAGALALLGVRGEDPAPVIAAPGYAPRQAESLTLVDQSNPYSYHVYLPVAHQGCQPIPGVNYGRIAVASSAYDPGDPDPENNPDYNLLLLGYVLTDEYKGLVFYDGPTDPKAPQLPYLFDDLRTPVFSNVYRSNGWDWDNDVPLPPPPVDIPNSWPVSVAGLEVTPGEVIHVPDGGYDIGYGYEVMVLYATEEQITLKYTREDDIVWGYTIYVTGVCVEPSLLALYQALDAAGRHELPALRGGEPFGRARDTQIDVGIRDNAVFGDPRCCKDWWKGRCP